MRYSLDKYDVRKVIDAVLNDKKYDAKQFMYYHLHRNYFNVKNEVKSLTLVKDNVYKDNLGNTWEELGTLKNWFHMPKKNWFRSILFGSTPYSRKFLRPDKSPLGGEFEMIIRHDGKRIDALAHEVYQETYNFASASQFWNHKKLDVETHSENPHYTFKKDMGRVKIIE